MLRSFRSEWLKLRRPAMVLGTAGSLAALSILGVVLSVLRADNARGPLQIARLSQPDGFAAIMQRATDLIGVIVLGAVAIAVAQEYTHGTLRGLLVREPRRLQLLGGKVLADLSFAATSVAVAIAAALGVALAIAPAKGIDTSGWLASGLGTTLSTSGDIVLAAMGYGVFGAMLALLFRSSAPAVIAGLAWALPIESLLAAAWSSVGRWLPMEQLGGIAAHGSELVGYTQGLLVGAAFVIAAAVVGGAVFRQRDVAV